MAKAPNRNSNTRSASPRKGSSLLAGILIGMVLGLLAAGGVAWYILKMPSPFMDNVPHEAARLLPDSPKSAPVVKTAPAEPTASGVADDKPRFEFYKVLTDKQESPVPGQKDNARSAAPENKATTQSGYLQAGSFSSADDADRLKAKLAMLGMEASVQTATLPDKSVWYRVRLGPYKSAGEMEKVRATLKQNGMDATPNRMQ